MCCQFSEFNVSRSDFVNWAPWLWRSMSIHVDFAPIYFPHTHQMNVISKRNVSCIFFCFNVNKAFHWAKFVFVCLFMFRFLTLVIYSFKWCNVSLKWIYTHTKSDAAMRKRCTKRFASEKTRDKQWSGNRLFETTRIHMKVAEIDQPILCRMQNKDGLKTNCYVLEIFVRISNAFSLYSHWFIYLHQMKADKSAPQAVVWWICEMCWILCWAIDVLPWL